MKLLADDINQVYVWIDESNENVELSPRFDYEDDALQWKEKITAIFQDNKGNTK